MGIVIKDLVKIYNYNKKNEFKALNGVSLEIKDGEMVAIIGKSGSGKSTLLNILAGISEYNSGNYKVDGDEKSEMKEKQIADFRNKKVGLVMQDFALIEGYSVLENVMIPLIIAKDKNQKEKAKDAIRNVDLINLKDKKVVELSGGQKQRIAIARAMVNNPSIILADEPTGALDTKTSKEKMELFKKLNEQGKTVIIVTHDLEIADSCERTIEIVDGNI